MVLGKVEEFFEREQFSWALIGAFGLQVYGLTRATNDLDLVTEGAAQQDLLGFLASTGYEAIHVSPGYSNHFHPDVRFGRLDIVYVSGDTSRQIFEGCKSFTVANRTIRVPRAEHLAAMKVQAMKNDPERTLQEMADIRFLLSLPGVNSDEIRGYFERSDLQERYEEIQRLG